MQTIIVAAYAQNRVIGKAGGLVWRLPNDLKRFKELTLGHPIIMGRKTFDSIGKPLPGRTSIVITRDKNYNQESSIIIAYSLDEAISEAKNLSDKVFIIGGGEIYKQALPLTDKMYLTEVKASPDGDTFFPKFSAEEWKESGRVYFKKDEKNEYDFDFVTVERAKMSL